MATLERLSPGQELYDVRGREHGSRNLRYFVVRVLEIDRQERRVLASHNGNPARWVGEREVKKWRVHRPGT